MSQEIQADQRKDRFTHPTALRLQERKLDAATMGHVNDLAYERWLIVGGASSATGPEQRA